jgi:hypothetical protein
MLWLLFLVACTAQVLSPTPSSAPTPTDLAPATATSAPEDNLLASGALSSNILPSVQDAVPGWQLDGSPKRYDSDTLFDFMNGAADLYFTYGFESLTVGQYVNDEAQALQIEVYGTASEADAYGLFTYNSYGEPIDLGVDGELDSGYRLAFWQSRHYVQIVARETVDDDILRAFGRAVASALPGGGQRPSLVDALPQEGLDSSSVRFFREKMALDNLLWLGSDDVLGLGPDVEGLVAHYARDGQDVDLLLVTFPDAQRAAQALARLENASLDTLAVADAQDKTLGAAFGAAASEAVARTLLQQALTASGK